METNLQTYSRYVEVYVQRHQLHSHNDNDNESPLFPRVVLLEVYQQLPQNVYQEHRDYKVPCQPQSIRGLYEVRLKRGPLLYYNNVYIEKVS